MAGVGCMTTTGKVIVILQDYNRKFGFSVSNEIVNGRCACRQTDRRETMAFWRMGQNVFTESVAKFR